MLKDEDYLETAVNSRKGVRKILVDLMDNCEFFNEITIHIPIANIVYVMETLLDNEEILFNRCVSWSLERDMNNGRGMVFTIRRGR